MKREFVKHSLRGVVAFSAIVVAMTLVSVRVEAQSFAQLTFPANGATAVDTRQPFTWNSVSGALAYYLYVGSSAGAKDLYNTGEIPSTSLLIPNLPTGPTIWLRLWTKTSNGWIAAPDVSFVAATSYVPPATFIYPADGTAAADTANQQFRWSPASNAIAYQLTIGTTTGGSDLFDSGETQLTGMFVPALPTGTQLHARLGTKTAGPSWTYVEITFVASTSYAARAQLTFPANGASGVDTRQPFTWTAVDGALSYYLYVGSTAGAKDLYNSGEIQSTSLPVPNLPVGPSIWLRLWTKTASGWVAAPDVSFVAGTSYVPPATFIYPTNGMTNADTANQQFRWTAAANSAAYQLAIGTSPGTNDLFDSGETSSTGMFVPSLPTGTPLYARLGTKAADAAWTYVNITFTAATTYVARAVVTFPANGATNVDTRQQITWNSVSGALAYYLYVGSTAGAKDLFNSGEAQSTALLVPNLPVGTTIWLRLWTKTSAGWLAAPDVSFVAGASYTPPAAFIYPTNGMPNADTANQQFRWTAATGALGYQLTVGTTSGASNLFDSGETAALGMFVPALPTGTQLFARLGTKTGGPVWAYVDIAFTATTTYVPRAQITFPLNGATNVDTRQPITWTSVTGALAYYLYVGSTAGAKDLYNSGETQATSALVPNLPVGPAIWLRIYTKTASGWLAAPDATFVAGTSYILPATFLYPTNGMSNADTANQQFRWTSVPNAIAYQLTVGTVSGGNDLFDSGETSATSTFVPALPTGTQLYAKLGTKAGDSTWSYVNIAFAAATTYVRRAVLTYPAPGATTIDLTLPFTWTSVTGAQAYYLYVGSNPGTKDVYDSGEISSTARYVGDASLGATLYVTLWTQVSNVWYSVSNTFTVSKTASFEDHFSAARSLANTVRQMAGTDNVPTPGSLLATITQNAGRTESTCWDYATTLQNMIAAQDLVSSRLLTICFNTNRSDLLDCHTLVEVFDTDTSQWIILDPTFALAAKKSATSQWATAGDISAATVAKTWSAITYVPLSQQGTAWANDYYVDYPLLYSNVYENSATIDPGTGNSVVPFIAEIPFPVTTYGVYVLSTDTGTGANVVIDGFQRTVPCDGIDGVSVAFFASSIVVGGNADRVHVYQIRRNVFPKPDLPFSPQLVIQPNWISPGTLASFKNWQDKGKSHLWDKKDLSRR